MLLALLLCYGGFTALCLSMDRHHAELLGRKPSAAAAGRSNWADGRCWHFPCGRRWLPPNGGSVLSSGVRY